MSDATLPRGGAGTAPAARNRFPTGRKPCRSLETCSISPGISSASSRALPGTTAMSSRSVSAAGPASISATWTASSTSSSGTTGNFIKNRINFRHVSRLFGQGLLTSDGQLWQAGDGWPHPPSPRGASAPTIATWSRRRGSMLDGWHGGDVIDVHPRMMALALRVVVRTIFGSDIGPHIARDGEGARRAHFRGRRPLQASLPHFRPRAAAGEPAVQSLHPHDRARHRRNDRGTEAERNRGPGRSALATHVGTRRGRQGASRCAASRRDNDASARRARDHGARPFVDDPSPRAKPGDCAAGGRRGAARDRAEGCDGGGRGPPEVRRGGRARVDAPLSARLDHRTGGDRQLRDRPVPDSRRNDGVHEPVGPASRSAAFRGARRVPPAAMVGVRKPANCPASHTCLSEEGRASA